MECAPPGAQKVCRKSAVFSEEGGYTIPEMVPPYRPGIVRLVRPVAVFLFTILIPQLSMNGLPANQEES